MQGIALPTTIWKGTRRKFNQSLEEIFLFFDLTVFEKPVSVFSNKGSKPPTGL
jgi:hypothetical protein